MKTKSEMLIEACQAAGIVCLDITPAETALLDYCQFERVIKAQPNKYVTQSVGIVDVEVKQEEIFRHESGGKVLTIIRSDRHGLVVGGEHSGHVTERYSRYIIRMNGQDLPHDYERRVIDGFIAGIKMAQTMS